MLGGLWLVPDQWIPEGSWLIGAGLIMLGLKFGPLHKRDQNERVYTGFRYDRNFQWN